MGIGDFCEYLPYNIHYCLNIMNNREYPRLKNTRGTSKRPRVLCNLHYMRCFLIALRRTLGIFILPSSAMLRIHCSVSSSKNLLTEGSFRSSFVTETASLSLLSVRSVMVSAPSEEREGSHLIYRLDGTRTASMQEPGLYIKDGKKILVNT